MFCDQCGNRFNAGAKFCHQCGTPCGAPQDTLQMQSRQNQPYSPPPYPLYRDRTSTVGANAPGRTYLKVTGIIWIIFGVLGLFGFLWIFDSAGLEELIPYPPGNYNAFMWSMNFIYAAFSVLTGIMSVVNCSNPEKGGLLLALGIITFVSYMIYSFAYLGFIYGFGSLLIAGPILVFHVIGAIKNMAVDR